MDVIYTDKNRVPVGVMKKYSIDLDNGDTNDFEIQTNIKNHNLDYGSIWYVENEEFGGIVDSIKVDTFENIVYYNGRSWRGFWDKKIIQPDTGQAYYRVSGDANDVIMTIINRLKLGDLFVSPSTPSGITISNFQFDRYCTGYDGLIKMLDKVNAKPKFVFDADEGKVVVSAVAISDLSSQYEYSDDYGMKLIMEENKGCVNHLICLGSGELAARTVLHLYVNAKGEIVKKQYYKGLKEICETYDFGNSTDDEELEKNGIENLNEMKNYKTMDAEFSKLDVDIGDIVGGKNRSTGMTLKEKVRSQIVTIKNGLLTIQYKVGD